MRNWGTLMVSRGDGWRCGGGCGTCADVAAGVATANATTIKRPSRCGWVTFVWRERVGIEPTEAASGASQRF